MYFDETKQEIKKRQEIGRGLRLCVNQNGERLKGFEINTLTVMANESYDDFAQKLQSEIETEEGIKFGLIETHTFANIQVVKEDGTETTLGYDKSAELFLHCKAQGYIDEKGVVTDTLRQAIKTNTVVIPEEFTKVKSAIYSTLRKSCGTLNIKNADEKVEIKLNKQVQLSPEFKDLWDRIKWKTRYNVAFDTNELIEKCAKRLNEKVVIISSTLKETKATLNVTQGGVQTSETQNRARLVNEEEKLLPDIISYLQNETDLTRKTIVDILLKSDTLDGFKKNPQLYMTEVAKHIKMIMKEFIVDGIKYTKIGDDKFYAQELFDINELSGYLKNTIETQKSIYTHIIYDSLKEEDFASKFEKNEDVKLYIKLPNWFKIPTPIGNYNPDWAILLDVDGTDKLYFVLETKSGKNSQLFEEPLRESEKINIECGRKHFEALNTKAEFKTANEFDKFMQEAVKI